MSDSTVRASVPSNLARDAGPDIFYVAEKALKSLTDLLENGGQVTKEAMDAFVRMLVYPESLPRDATMIPVDMSVLARCYDYHSWYDVDDMIDRLGRDQAARAFVMAADHFVANVNNEPMEVRAQTMTAAEWTALLQQADDDSNASLSAGAQGGQEGEAKASARPGLGPQQLRTYKCFFLEKFRRSD